MIHETDVDRLEERLIAAEVSEIWGVTFVKNGPLAALDWHILDKNGVYFGSAEAKRRLILPTTYSTIILSERKYKDLQNSANRNGEAFFIVKFNGGSIWSVDIKTIPSLKARMGGRTDREGDNPNDLELVVDIPMSSFTRVCRHEFTMLSSPPTCAKCGAKAQ